jgi:proteasome beta subunit
MSRGDFLDLLLSSGYSFVSPSPLPYERSNVQTFNDIHGTTIMAMKYKEGVIVVGDRRAVSGTAIIHDRADKVMEIDERSVLAISGSPAMAVEIARTLEHSIKYYRRSQLQDMSLEGKLRMLSRLLKENLPLALQGIGPVVPIFATYDLPSDSGKIYFYDLLGARFESAEFATSGSGSIWIRGALYYLNRWEKPLSQRDLEEGLAIALRLMDAAAEYDAATGGYSRGSHILPTVKVITRDGVNAIDDGLLMRIYEEHVETRDVRAL